MNPNSSNHLPSSLISGTVVVSHLRARNLLCIFNFLNRLIIACSVKRTQSKNKFWIFAIVNTKEEKYFKKLGAKIKALREEKGLDQKAFAFDCEIGRTQLHMIENGKTNPRLLTLIKIARALEISLSKLVDIG